MKGSESKKIITKKILEMFKDSFLYNDGKEIRIPMEENGERVEIKIALTCAKTNVGGDDALVESGNKTEVEVNAPAAQPTAEEKENIAKLMDRLGI